MKKKPLTNLSSKAISPPPTSMIRRALPTPDYCRTPNTSLPFLIHPIPPIPSQQPPSHLRLHPNLSLPSRISSGYARAVDFGREVG
jgi:hypothetical protein